ncbi:MAG: hypothetical protein A2X49_03465 [Lentisphaerae bacterium GWF2_52_8]|nr:MAG: hypothetical protein A2X49_03465 [Lentisphaerae bacterium GWF2_52_8]
MSVLDNFSLKGKVALLTGGAGLYGQQILKALAEAGATSYIASRNVKALEELAAGYCAQGLDVRALKLDQADEKSIIAVRDEIVKRNGHLDILVNNAVARPPRKGLPGASVLAESMSVNATGLMVLTQIMGEILADGASIINIGSIMGLVGIEPLNYRGTDMGISGAWSSPDYFFHKGGMVNITRFWASYYGQRGIRCNCVHPGGLQTPDHPEAFVRNYSERTCLGRLANDTDLMGAIVFLASDASRYVTGTNIPIDGGYTAK